MPSQLDLIFTTELEMVSDVQHMVPLGRSDHQMLKFNLNCYAKHTGTHKRFNYNRGDNEDARQELQEVPSVVYQPLTFISSDILDHQIDITIILCFILWKNNCSSS